VLSWFDETAYEASGDWYSGFTNLGLPGSDKVGISVAVRSYFYGSPTGTFNMPVIGYRTLEDASLTSLGTPFGYLYNGVFDVPVLPAGGSGPPQSATYFYYMSSDRGGIHFEEIELGGTIYAGTIIKWVAFYYIRQMAGSFGWTVTFDMTEEVDGRSPKVQRNELIALFEEGSVYPLRYNFSTYYAAFSTWEGIEWTGKSEDRSLATVTLFQVRERP
jgi:hypothetical protein